MQNDRRSIDTIENGDMFAGLEEDGGSDREKPSRSPRWLWTGRNYNMHAPVPKVAELGVDPKEHPTSGLSRAGATRLARLTQAPANDAASQGDGTACLSWKNVGFIVLVISTCSLKPRDRTYTLEHRDGSGCGIARRGRGSRDDGNGLRLEILLPTIGHQEFVGYSWAAYRLHA